MEEKKEGLHVVKEGEVPGLEPGRKYADEVKPPPTQEGTPSKEVLGASNETVIKIIVTRTPQGIDCRFSEDTALPMNDIYIRGIFDKAKDMAMGMLFSAMQSEAAKNKSKILKPSGNPLINGLRGAGRKILSHSTMKNKGKKTKTINEKLLEVKKVKALAPVPVPYAYPGPGETTSEEENERVLVEHQGANHEMVIVDRTNDGKYTKIGETRADAKWKLTSTIKIVHTFTEKGDK